MPSVFRRPWMYQQLRFRRKLGVAVLNNTTVITGQAANTAFTTVSITQQRTFTGVAANVSIGSPTVVPGVDLSGVAAITDIGSTHFDKDLGVLTGQHGTATAGSFVVPISSNISLSSNFVTAATGRPTGDHPLVFVNGQSVTGMVPATLFRMGLFDLFGMFATAQIPAHAFFESPIVDLRGLQVVAIGFSASGAGGGGGGAAGLYGPGESGFGGSANGGGGHGGDADDHIVFGAIVPGSMGLSGNELALGYGSGSGGAGASFSSGAGATVYNYNGTIFLSYISSITNALKFHTFTTSDNANSPFQIPDDWTNQNVVSLVGSGCANHGDTQIFNNVNNFNPGDFVAFFCSPFCSQLPTTFGTYSCSSGVLSPTVDGQKGGDAGFYGGGGGGGTGGGGGRGADGLIFLQYKSTIDNTTINTVIFTYDQNHHTPYTIPADWSESNFVYLQGSGGCGGVGSQTQGGNGGGGAGNAGGYDTTAFTPGQLVPFFVSPACSGLPTVFGSFAARSGANGDTAPTGYGLLDHFQFVLPCNGTGGDGTVGPPRPPGGSILVE